MISPEGGRRSSVTVTCRVARLPQHPHDHPPSRGTSRPGFSCSQARWAAAQLERPTSRTMPAGPAHPPPPVPTARVRAGPERSFRARERAVLPEDGERARNRQRRSASTSVVDRRCPESARSTVLTGSRYAPAVAAVTGPQDGLRPVRDGARLANDRLATGPMCRTRPTPTDATASGQGSMLDRDWGNSPSAVDDSCCRSRCCSWSSPACSAHGRSACSRTGGSRTRHPRASEPSEALARDFQTERARPGPRRHGCRRRRRRASCPGRRSRARRARFHRRRCHGGVVRTGASAAPPPLRSANGDARAGPRAHRRRRGPRRGDRCRRARRGGGRRHRRPRRRRRRGRGRRSPTSPRRSKAIWAAPKASPSRSRCCSSCSCSAASSPPRSRCSSACSPSSARSCRCTSSGSLMDVSVYALNLAFALALGLAVDFGLLIVSRYRDELRDGITVGKAPSPCAAPGRVCGAGPLAVQRAHRRRRAGRVAGVPTAVRTLHGLRGS